MATETQKDAFANIDVSIEKAGRKIILPNDPREMTEDEAITALKRKKEQQNMTVSIYEEVNAFPLEGAYALMKVLQFKYGWVDSVPTPGFFGPNPPTMVTLETGYDKKTQVIWGSFQVPGVEGTIETNASYKNGRPTFVITGEVKKRYQGEIQALANDVRTFVKNYSLYKGQAVRINTKKNKDGGYSMDLDKPPTFMDVDRVKAEELIFSDDVQALIATNLYTPIEKTELCRKHKVPLKRGILLEGPYGTGKTLTAYVTAKKAVENGWTFIYLDRVAAIKEAIIFAREFSPAVIFAEDVERIVEGDRTTAVDDVLNNIDGLDSKGQEIICVFTTNHVDQINKAMLRPGRLDAVITVAPPDAKAAEKLVRFYSQGLIAANDDLTAAGKELKGQIPATIREVVERSKLAAIGRTAEGEEIRLTGEDVRVSAIGMKNHIKVMNPPEKPVYSDEEKLGIMMGLVMRKADEGFYDSFDTTTVDNDVTVEVTETTVQ